MIAYMPSATENTGIILHVEAQSLWVEAYRENVNGPVAGTTLSPELGSRRFEVGKRHTASLAELKGRPEWKDHSIWALAMRDMNMQFTPMFNRTALTLTSRMNPTHFVSTFSIPVRMMFVVPHKNALFTEMGICVAVGSGCPLLCNLPAIEADANHVVASVMPRLSLSGPSAIPTAGGTFVVNVLCPDSDDTYPHPVEVELDHVNGYLPLTRLNAEGFASFNVIPFGMQSGQPIKIKAGFRFWEAATEKEVTVQ